MIVYGKNVFKETINSDKKINQIYLSTWLHQYLFKFYLSKLVLIELPGLYIQNLFHEKYRV